MMKKAFAFLLCFAFFILTACGHAAPDETASATETAAQEHVSESDTKPEPITSVEMLAANGTYGETNEVGAVAVRDESIRYRTDDSYRLESIAVQAAIDAFRKTLIDPDSLQISDCSIGNCLDDGENAYFGVHIVGSYLLPSGERIEGSGFYDFGVNKADETAFDASGSFGRLMRAYSVYDQADRNTVIEPDENDADTFAAAAKQIALSRLKHSQSGKLISAEQRSTYGSDDLVFVWDVLCEGENDFGQIIPEVYTVYLRSEDGRIVEFDPADPE